MKTSPANWIWLDISYRPSFKHSRANELASSSHSLSLSPSLINHRLSCSRFALTKCRSFGFPSPFVLYVIFTLLLSLKLKHASLNITLSQHWFTVNNAAVPNGVHFSEQTFGSHFEAFMLWYRVPTSKYLNSIWLWPLFLFVVLRYCIIHLKLLREEETHLLLLLNPFIFRKQDK